jgi:uncharacterized membrane protein
MIIARERLRTLDLATLFNWFIIYSIIGWVYETAYCYLTNGRIMNRGFLYGPLIPIYGLSILAMIVLFTDRCRNVITLFLSCSLVATALEYFSSYWMELVFHRRWWNYYKMSYNLNGRICLGASILFGLCGILFVRIIHPAIVKFLAGFSETFMRRANRLLLTLFIMDVLFSFHRSLTR